jgi:hypothetical protein
MPARFRLSWGMKSFKLFLLRVLDSLEFGWQVIRYALIFVSAFFRQRASLACEMVAMRSQFTFYEESIRQKRQPRPRFNPAFRLLWVLLSSAVNITQSAWRGKTQSPKTANAVRKIDLHSSLSAMLKTFVNGRVEGFLFSSASGRPLTQGNVLRDGFGKIRKDLSLDQDGMGFHAFRRFHTTLEKKPCAVGFGNVLAGACKQRGWDRSSGGEERDSLRKAIQSAIPIPPPIPEPSRVRKNLAGESMRKPVHAAGVAHSRRS